MQKNIVIKPRANLAHMVELQPSAYSTYVGLSAMGYTSNAAILDIIDNCVEAGATRIDVMVKDISGGKGKDFVIDILDNGPGMDDAKLRVAMTLGSKRDREPEGWGKFGFGLKTAALSLGRSLRVLSRMEGKPAVQAMLDLDRVQEHDKFWVDMSPVQSEEIVKRRFKHGTLVSISKVPSLSDTNPSRFHDALRQDVGRVYRDSIAAGIEFYIGPKKAARFDPLMLEHPLTEVKLDADIALAPGKVAHVKVVDLPDINDDNIRPRNSGFYVMRNGREIVGAHGLGFEGLDTHHHSYQHFRAEIRFGTDLDNLFRLGVKKDDVELNDQIRERLRNLVGPLISASAAKSRLNAVPRPPVLPTKSHERAVQILSRRSVRETAPVLTFSEADHGEDQPMFQVKGESIVYNSSHPVLRLIENEGRQSPGVLLDIMAHALAKTAASVPEGDKFMEVLESNLVTALRK